MRGSRLGQPRFQEAIVALGTEAGIAFLEKQIASPVDKVWGLTLFELQPSWSHLNRWIRLSKLHCLAAVDALVWFTCASGAAPQIPKGADLPSIHNALDFAMAHYGNPRMETAAKEIRYIWPLGPRKRHVIVVPEVLFNAATIILGLHSGLMDEWKESMETGREPCRTAFEFWDSLIEFSQSKTIVAIVDWKEWPDSVVASLKALKSASQIAIDWRQFTDFDGRNEELFRAINLVTMTQGLTLVCLNRGSDDYPLTFIPSDSVLQLRALISSFRDHTMQLKIFD